MVKEEGRKKERKKEERKEGKAAFFFSGEGTLQANCMLGGTGDQPISGL